MELINESAVYALYAAGGVLGRSISGEWWLYEVRHLPDKARRVQPDVPTALAVQGVLVPSGRDRFAAVTLYALAPLRSSIDQIAATEEQQA